MSQSNDHLHLLALLVHRGYLTKPQGQAVAQLLNGGSELPDALCQASGMDADHAQWLVDTKAGQYPRIPGFEVGACLGRGGTAEVFQVEEKKTGKTMVLKILGPNAMRQKGTLKAFVAEGKRLAQLEHEGLVAGYGMARYGGVVFCKMECIQGETLQDALDRQGVMEEDQALSVALQVAQVLRYLAQEGLVHRDVKPGNIMITEKGAVKLIDLGFCAAQDEANRQGLAVGTVEYLSPEQALGGAAADVRSDIYSLGVTLFQMTVGRLPFEGDGSEDVLRRHVTEVFQSPELKGRHLSPQLQYFIEKMLDKDAEVRFQSYDELIEEVRGQLEGSKRWDYTQGEKKAASTPKPKRPGSRIRRKKR